MARSKRRSTRQTALPSAVQVEVVEPRVLLSGTNGLEAVLTGDGGALGKAEFKVKEGIRSFEVEVLRGNPGLYNVSVDGTRVGEIRVRASGLGSMELTDAPEDHDEFPFPADWPGIAAGSEVSIEGLAAGSIEQDGNDDTVVSNLVATATGANGQFAVAEFEVELEDGAEEREFELQAYNLPAAAEVPLSIDGVTVAHVTTSSLGTLRVRYSDRVRPNASPFPATFPAPVSGSEIRIGDAVVGTFENRPPDQGPAGHGDHLRISLTGTGVESGRSEYEIVRNSDGAILTEEFKVEVWNAEPGQSFDVIVKDVTVGQISISRRGYGKLDFERGDDSKPFPTDWPGVSADTTVTVGNILSGAFQGSGRPADPGAENMADAYRFDHALGLQSSGNLFENYGNRGEKWLKGKAGEWYFLTPDGALYRWNQGAAADGDLVTILDPAFHSQPDLLVQSTAMADSDLDDDLLVATSAELDAELSLRAAEDNYEDWGGMGEKWLKGGEDDWYFVTSDGVLTKWDRQGRATGTIVASFDSRYHQDLSRLTDGLTRLDDSRLAFAADRGLNLRQSADDFFDWGGRQEKWVRGDDDWFFITSDGTLHRWNRTAGANGTRITVLSREYYDDLSLLTDASAVGSVPSQQVLDDVFTDSDLLF